MLPPSSPSTRRGMRILSLRIKRPGLSTQRHRISRSPTTLYRRSIRGNLQVPRERITLRIRSTICRRIYKNRPLMLKNVLNSGISIRTLMRFISNTKLIDATGRYQRYLNTTSPFIFKSVLTSAHIPIINTPKGSISTTTLFEIILLPPQLSARRRKTTSFR